MGVSFKELREVCQAPVAARNDVAGLLYGDRFSLPITKAFVDLGWSPSAATVGMLAAGLLGAGLQFAGSTLALVGALLLVLYYLLDCVDGEVARWHEVEHARWGYYEYIFHFVVKPLAFLSIGFAEWGGQGSVLLLLAAVSAAITTLWLKLFFAVPSLVFVGSVLRGSTSGERPYRDYLALAVARVEQSHDGGEREEVFRLGFDRVTLRSLATNFDVGLLLLALATAVDLMLGPWLLGDWGSLSARGLWLIYYGVVLPIDFLDYVRSYFGRKHFDESMVRLLARAHGFEVRPSEGADESGERTA